MKNYNDRLFKFKETNKINNEIKEFVEKTEEFVEKFSEILIMKKIANLFPLSGINLLFN